MTTFSYANDDLNLQQLDQNLINTLDYYKTHYPKSMYAQFNKEQEKQLLIHAYNIKRENQAMNSGTALSQALKTSIRLIATEQLKDIGYRDPNESQLRAAEKLVGVLGVTKQRFEVAVNLATITVSDITALDLDSFDNPIKNDVLKGIVANRDDYGNLNTLHKLKAVFDYYNNEPPASKDVLLFAKRLNNEVLFKDDIVKQIKQVDRTYTLMKLANQNVDDPNSYKGALDDREEIYAYMLQTYAIEDNNIDLDQDQGFFQVTIDNILFALNLEFPDKLNLGENVTVSSGLAILKFQAGLEEDREKLERAFNVKKDTLIERLDNGNESIDLVNYYEQLIRRNYQLDDNYDQTNDFRDYEESLRPLKAAGAYYIMYDDMEGQHIIDMKEDNVGVRGEIDRIFKTTRENPIRLQYKRLTYENIWSASIDQNLPEVSDNDFDSVVKQPALRTISDDDFDNLEAALSYRQEVESKFNRVMNPNAPVNWKARVQEIWTKVPESKIDANIPRPGDLNHNADIWNLALLAEQKLVLQSLAGAIADCNTGVNQKLSILENSWKDILGNMNGQSKTPIISAIANIVEDMKMRVINDTGKNPGPRAIGGGNPTLADEENVTAPFLLQQRLTIPWGLVGSFQEVNGPRHGYGFEGKNSPVQITKNLFLREQPARPYNIGTMNDPNYQDVPLVAPPITIKSLTERIYDEFDKTITYPDIMKYINGNYDLRCKDQMNPILMNVNGIFIKEFDQARTAKGSFTREMAFYLAEKLQLIKMTRDAKEHLFQADQDAPGEYTFNGTRHTLREWIDEDIF